MYRQTEHSEVLPNGITITLEIQEEDIPVRGNAMCSGDDEADKLDEDKIIARLEHDLWAWCCVRIVASIDGFEGDTYLGACSYADVKDFMSPGGYYPQMVSEAIDDLKRSLGYAMDRGAHAKVVLEKIRSSGSLGDSYESQAILNGWESKNDDPADDPRDM